MTPIQTLKIPPAKIKQLSDRGINYLEDLLKYFPKDYLDFSHESEVSIENTDKNVAIIGVVDSVKRIGGGKGIQATLSTDNGMNLYVLWFNQDYLYEKLSYVRGAKVIVCGKLEYDTRFYRYSIKSPITFSRAIKDSMKIIPVYKKIPGMSYDYLTSLIADARKRLVGKETLADSVKKAFRLCDYDSLFDKIHAPKSQEDINASKRRLIFEDMFYMADKLYQDTRIDDKSDFVIKANKLSETVLSNLPFELTEDQKNSFQKIADICSSGKRLDALIQGDVGSGKSIIAFLSMIMFAENDYQSVLLAPTQVLALQHYEDLKKITDPLGIKVVLLKSQMRVKEKRETLAAIATGAAKIIVGTHAVFSKDVLYDKLGLTIVDEEHKFGVAQREAIAEKGNDGVHTITMSATPIPRSLALTLYGINKEIITISQMPKGRKPIITKIIDNDDAVNEFLLKEIQGGHQCYIVCPAISKSDSDLFEGVDSVETVYEKTIDWFSKNAPQVKISVITGKMKAAEIENTINEFSAGNTNILLSTTIIEVGVNVPNANTIVIKSAERFGLAQLHQLRGRVGRGNDQAYCLLQSACDENKRLQILCDTTDGFKIAEADLKIRGTGDLIGTVQTGDNKYVKLIVAYPRFFESVKKYVEKIYSAKT